MTSTRRCRSPISAATYWAACPACSCPSCPHAWAGPISARRTACVPGSGRRRLPIRGLPLRSGVRFRRPDRPSHGTLSLIASCSDVVGGRRFDATRPVPTPTTAMQTPLIRPVAPRRPAPARSAIRRYGAAIVVFVAALIIRYPLRGALGAGAPYLFFSPAVILASWYGGLGPGVLTTVFSIAAAAYFFMPPTGFAVTGPGDHLSLAIFGATGLFIAWLSQRLHDTQDAQGEATRTAVSRAERLDAILNTTTAGIIVTDSRGQIETFNPAAEQLFGYSRDEVIGRNVSVLMPSPFREEHDGYVSRYLRTGHATVIGIGREVTGQRKDGRLFPLRLSVGEFRSGGERKFTGVVHDLSARVQMESALRERDALAKLGELAAVVAHEVKNPLAGISGAIQVLDSSLASRGERLPVLREIIDRIGALDCMLRELLMFARPLAPRPVEVEIVPLVVTTAALLSA